MENNNVKKSNNLIIIIIAVIVALGVGSGATWFIMDNNDSAKSKSNDTKEEVKETKKDDTKEEVKETKKDDTKEEKKEEKKDDEVQPSKDDYYFGICKLKGNDSVLVSVVKFYSNQEGTLTSYDIADAKNVIDLKTATLEQFNSFLYNNNYVCDSMSGGDYTYICKAKTQEGSLLGVIKYSTDNNSITNYDITGANNIVNISDYTIASNLSDTLSNMGYVCDSAINNN